MLKIPKIQHIGRLPLSKNKKLLVVGKGPSAASWNANYLNDYNVIGINHAAFKFNTPISHFTDYEMLKDQPSQSKFVICPAFMNYKYKTTKDLRSMIYEDREINLLYKEKRLFSYDIITPNGFTTELFQEKPFIFKYASGVLIVQLAIYLQMEELFTLGIDGGTKYHVDFESTKGNGQFLDEQLETMKRLAEGKVEIIKL